MFIIICAILIFVLFLIIKTQKEKRNFIVVSAKVIEECKVEACGIETDGCEVEFTYNNKRKTDVIVGKHAAGSTIEIYYSPKRDRAYAKTDIH